jgi:uncharacterized OB-fold protein
VTEPSASQPSAAYAKPLPEPTEISRPFWEAARGHRLLIQRSTKTGKYVFYPRAVSPFGTDDELEWVEVPGRGTVYSFTVARRPTAPQWAGDEPYVIAIVELDEGVHMTANILECEPDAVRIGMPVEVTFQDVSDEISLPQFRPAAPASA